MASSALLFIVLTLLPLYGDSTRPLKTTLAHSTFHRLHSQLHACDADVLHTCIQLCQPVSTCPRLLAQFQVRWLTVPR